MVQEKPLPKAKKRDKSTPLSQIEEDVLDIIRAGRKGESVLDMIRAGKKANLARAKSLPRLPAEKKKAEEFFIGDLDLAKLPNKNLRIR